MFWHCNTCGHDNEEMDTTCLLCGSPKPVTVAPEKIPVCSLTATRAKAECNYADVTVPSKYNVIGEDAFKGRTDLYTIRIHSGVTKILRGAFDGCTNLYAVYVEGKLASIGPRAFAGCKYLSPDKRPAAETVAPDAFVGCSNISLGIPARTVASSTAARKTSSTSTKPKTTGSYTSPTRPAPSPSGTSSFTKSTGAKPGTSSFTKTTGTRPAPSPPPPPPPKSTVPVSTRTTYTPPKPSPSPYTPSSTMSGFDGYAAFGICAAATVVAFVVAFLLADWGLFATWDAWQTAISLALVGFAGVFSHYWMCEEKYGIVAAMLTGVTAISALNWLFGGGMTYMSVILAVGAFALSFVFAYPTYNNGDDDIGVWLIIVTLANLAHLIATLIVYNYNVTGQLWQIIIALAILIFLSCGIHCGCYDSDLGLPLGLNIVAIVVAGCMLWWFGGMLVHFVSVLMLGAVAFSVSCSVYSFDKEGDNAFGVGFILTATASLALFVVANLLFA